MSAFDQMKKFSDKSLTARNLSLAAIEKAMNDLSQLVRTV
jgi:hypothetical protein